MRILTVSHFYESHGGGIERVAGQLSRQFARLGAEAAWAASDSDAPPGGIVEVVPLRCVNPTERLTGLPMPVPTPRALRLLAREVRRCDAVVIHDALYLTSIAAFLLAKAYGKRVILIQHIAGIAFASPLLRSVMNLANRLVTRPMLWAADERIFISDTVRHELLGTPPRIAGRLLFNGVDRDIFRAGDITPTMGQNGSAPILFVGRYVEKKGLAVLRALAELRPDWTFEMVGSGPIRPGDWKLANVRDLGTQSPHALGDLYRKGGLLLLPSVGEGYPLVIQEAMACGLPVVCGEPSNRADPGAARWLRGVAIDLGDPHGSARRCADAIAEFELSTEERSAMARYAAERYDWEAMAQGVMTMAGSNHTAAAA